MTGAGSSTVAYAEENSYLGGVGTSPTYVLPGTNIVFETAELGRNLQRIDIPGTVEADDHVSNQLEGQLGVQYVLNDTTWHNLVFNDGGTGFTSGTVPSAEWYLGVDHLDGAGSIATTERQIKGWVPQTVDVTYNGTTETVTVSMAGPYGDEVKNTSITPGTITNTSTGNEVPGHGAELQVNSTRVAKLRSATLSFENVTRLIRDSNTPKPVVAVPGNVTTTIDLSAVYDGGDLYEIALGSASATSYEDFADAQSATATFDRDGTTVADYSTSVAPTSYSWSDLVNNEADLSEAVTFNGQGGVTASAP